ncbi:MAG TPA: dienelactone hydrolase family protein [Vicinamibacterales bacterium]|nr:dienelactone hydrolase family protein [Vicinamibacterales bacterium]
MALRETGQARGRAALAGVLLHGRGKTPHEKIDLAARLDAPAFRWVVPEAASGSWYPRRFWDPIHSNEPSLTEALASADAAMREASESGRLGPERLAIVGFSQGACLAAEYVLRHPRCCGALVVLTGAILGASPSDWRASEVRLDGLPVLITGSDVDDWVEEKYVRETADIFSSLGADVRLRIYRGRPHVVSDAELAEAQALLGEMRRRLMPEPSVGRT